MIADRKTDVPDWLLRKARRVFVSTILERGFATPDHVRAGAANLRGLNPKWYGQVPRIFAQAGWVRKAGVTPTGRTEGRMRDITIWTASASHMADLREWLEKHPPIENAEAATPALTQMTLFDDDIQEQEL